MKCKHCFTEMKKEKVGFIGDFPKVVIIYYFTCPNCEYEYSEFDEVEL